MANKYVDTSKEIVENFGGKNNIKFANHCATRLRITAVDNSKINQENLNKIPGVLGVVKRDNEYQLVIGTDVGSLYAEFVNVADVQKEQIINENLDKHLTKIETESRNNKEKSQLNKTVDFISGIFVPILPILVAAGLVSAVLNIAITFLGLTSDSPTVVVLNAINSAGFYFLPIYLGYSSASKLNINPFMGAYLGAILVSSTIDGAEGLDFLGISIPTVTYANSVIPVILGVFFMSFVYKFLDNHIPKEIKYFINPLVTILITTPVTLIILGPLGEFIGNYLAIGLGWVNEKLGWLSVGLIGALTPLLVMTGTNQALFPLVFAGMADFGYEAFVMPGMLAANVAVGAAALASSYQSKDKTMKSLALSSGITGVMGITEPSIFGVLLPLQKPLYGAIVGVGIGGIFAGIFRLKQYAVVSPGIAALPTFIPTDGSGIGSNFYFAIGTLLISFAVSFIYTLILLRKDKN